MRDYLVFRLYGPLASWGEPAVGGDRPTSAYPSRSAVLGLLGAALGIKRDDETQLLSLQKSVCIGIKQCVPGSLLRDYHTAQVPSHDKKRIHRTRQSELKTGKKLQTVLSKRDYRCDGLWVVAVWLSPSATMSLNDLKKALLKPVYPLSLGRKSCPPALPLQPTLVANADLKSALDIDFPAITASNKSDALWLGATPYATYFWEGDVGEIDDERVLTTHPWDEPINRGRWQFKQRVMHQLTVKEANDVSV
ncbi:type I-E CRISPR-associated protein Cas5/CasD [Salinivibrio proteolyticus]|uniref:Type I-E CRISPR-associated protein Cas5/CasD n=1 Tax=Salinivibrio proteolyticus TaxID=334715 RepID=A0ABY7LIG5_9GAMM|nr:type I-E CRISPR-associated protein Cas5/CasD [Salinivibrio proteolyticus]WBA16422.1 type I-E CRISPR-associated protein Cas5/CasD [Salinivibrio proteolyticus]